MDISKKYYGGEVCTLSMDHFYVTKAPSQITHKTLMGFGNYLFMGYNHTLLYLFVM